MSKIIFLLIIAISSLFADFNVDKVIEQDAIIMSSSDEPMRKYITNSNLVIDTQSRCFNVIYWQRVKIRTVYYLDTQRALRKYRKIVFNNNETCSIRKIERIY